MVDTINPDTNQPDAPADGRFYGGFDKPADTRINLAENSTPQPVAPVQQAPVMTPTAVSSAPVQDVSAVAPAEVKHSSYVNTADMINWRGVLVIVGIGLLATLLVSTGIFFGANAVNSAKLKEQQANLDTIKSELTALQATPEALTLPVSSTPPVVTPTPTVVPTPVVTPAPAETPVTTPVEKITNDGTG
jgi:hypothetical protein